MRAGDLVDGRYELAEPLPDRGVGALWRARDARQRGAEVAIAFVAPAEGGGAPRALRRLPEIRHESVLAALRHGATAGVAYVVYEPLDAPTLASILTRAWAEGPLPAPKVLERIAERVCDALEEAHGLAPPLAHGALSTRSGGSALPDSGASPSAAYVGTLSCE